MFCESSFIKIEKDGNLAIHYAARKGSLEMLEILNKYGSVTNLQNYKLENALHIAAIFGRSSFISRFLSIENSKQCGYHVDRPSVLVMNKSFLTPHMQAICVDNQECLEILLSDKNTRLSDKTINQGKCLEFGHFFEKS